MMNTTSSSWLSGGGATAGSPDEGHASYLFRATPQREPGGRPDRSKANRTGSRAVTRPPTRPPNATSEPATPASDPPSGQYVRGHLVCGPARNGREKWPRCGPIGAGHSAYRQRRLERPLMLERLTMAAVPVTHGPPVRRLPEVRPWSDGGSRSMRTKDSGGTPGPV